VIACVIAGVPSFLTYKLHWTKEYGVLEQSRLQLLADEALPRVANLLLIGLVRYVPKQARLIHPSKI